MERNAARADRGMTGTVGGRYRLTESIDRGGMAEVFRARDTMHGRDVAVKFLQEEISSVVGTERFRREISIAATLSHPHIVPLFDSGQWNRRLFYVMPFVDGRNLRQVLEQEGPLDLQRVVGIARDVAQALAHAHSQGIVHRDIKPSNIILADEYALVTDFGVAKALGSRPIEDLTGAGMAVGTPRYMAPEQATDPGRVTSRADTYSLGCIVYEMITGSPPFAGAHLPGLIADHLLKDARSLDTVDPTIPHVVAEAVQRAIAKDPEERFETVTEFVEALERGVSGRPVERAGQRASDRAWWGAVAVAVMLVLIGLAWRSAPAGGWAEGRPESVLVVPFADPDADPTERELAIELADALTFELSWWDEVRPVPRIVQSGAMYDLGIEGPTVAGISQAVSLADRLGAVGTVLVRATRRPGDETVRAEYSLIRTVGGWFGRGRGTSVGPPTVIEAGMDPTALVEPMVRRLLGLETASPDFLGRRSGTRSRAALQQYDEAQRALSEWRLIEAEQRFDAALAEDSTFAMAHLGLAQTLYWQLAEDPGGMSDDLGPRILRASAAARRHVQDQDLPVRMLDHVEGFYAFATGDYPGARERYRTIVERDPNDVFGHLFRGSVEYRDPWVVEEPVRRPRSDLDLAVASFDRAVELNPDFELGYGHLFAIHRLVRDAAEAQGCLGYEAPRQATISPWDWESRAPERQELFCLVPGDSLRWVPGDRSDEIDRVAALTAAEALEARGLARLERWSDFKPESPRPLEELARVRREAYERISIGPPETMESAAEAAAQPYRRALALRTDTLANHLFTLANLEGAANRIELATDLVEEGLRRHASDTPDRAVPSLAANPLLAAGRLDEVMAVLAVPQRSMSVPSPEGGFIAVPPEAVLGAQHALAAGALLAPVEVLGPLLAGVEATWSDPGTTAPERDALRHFSGTRLLPALAAHSELVLAWTDPTSGDPLVRLARAAAEGSPDAPQLLSEVSEDPSVRESLPRNFTVARVAALLGDAQLAERHLAALDSIPLPLRQFSSTWGLKTGAAILRAELRLGVGDIEGAREALGTFRTLVPSNEGVALFLAERVDEITAGADTGR